MKLKSSNNILISFQIRGETVVMRVVINQTESIRDLNISVPEDHKWSPSQWIYNEEGPTDPSMTINKYLKDLKQNIFNEYLEVKMKLGNEPHPSMVIQSYFKRTQVVSRTFFQVMDEYLDARGLKKNTRISYVNTFYPNLERFFLLQFGSKEVGMASITSAHVYKFEIFLKSRPTHSRARVNPKNTNKLLHSSTQLYMDKFKAILRWAYKLGYIATDLTDKYVSNSIVRNPTAAIEAAPEALDAVMPREDLIKIEIAGPPRQDFTDRVEDMWRVRLIFLFQRWTGMSYADLEVQDIRKAVRVDLSGKKSICYNRVKTGELAIVPFFKETERILEDLEWDVHPGCAYKTFLHRTKFMFRWYGFDYWETVGTHWGRHLCGSEFLRSGYSMESVSRILGHASIKETEEVYAKINIEKLTADFHSLKAQGRGENLEYA